ncbi:MAG TPA: matrixin family metalloprotease [Chthoniobacterales bacterium]|jgi:hypothetical protein
MNRDRSIGPHLLSIALFACGVILLAVDLYGFALEGKSWPKGTVINMQMEMGAPDHTLQDGSTTWDDAAVPAIYAWNANMLNVQINPVMNSSKPVSSGDGISSASFSDTVFGEKFSSGVLAVTYYLSQSGQMTEADVLFNKAALFESYRGDLQFNSQGQCVCDIQRVFLHELGHALGLDHPDDHGQTVPAIMNSVVSNLYQLQPDDLAGIHSLYGTPTSTPSPSPTATPPTPNRLVNLSTRMQVGVGDNVLIGGFIIQGDLPKKIILRAIGPSLAQNGLIGVLQDPQLELHDAAGALLQSNDNWQDSPDLQDIIDSSLAPSDPHESAILARLAPGSYTAIVSGVNNTTGIGLVESYTLDTNATHAANISTRGRVGAGDDALIGGFIVGGHASKTILVRALGPSLGNSGVDNVLSDPLVEMYDANGQLFASNDNWQSGGQTDQITATGIAPSDPREAALIATVPGGDFTAVVRGADGGEGLGLVEIYDLNQ